MSKEKSDRDVEIGKAFIGCLGAVTVAIVTGIFAVVTNIGPRLPLLGGETRLATSPAPVVVIVIPTSQPVVLPTASAPTTALPTTARASNVVFGPIIFAPGITGIEPNMKPIDAATRFPEGTTKVYALFSYEAMAKGAQWRWERSLDGTPQPELGGTGSDLAGRGTFWIVLWLESGVPPGEWEFRLYVDERIVQKANYSIDRRPANAPFFGRIRFAEGIKDDKPVNPHGTTENFKAGTKEVYAFFDADNMTKGLKWKREWYRDGQLLSNLVKTEVWNSGQTEKDWWVKTFNDSGLASGTYELKFFLEDRLVQLGTFVVE